MTVGREELTGALLARLARRSPAFQHSVWDAVDLLVAGAGPETIFFGNGNPAPERVPYEAMQRASQRTWEQIGELPKRIEYGEPEGLPELRDMIAERMRARGVTATRDDILPTTGSQQAIDFLARLMLNPGDAVVVEGPTYLGALQVFDAYEVEYIVAPVDDRGLDVDRLRAMLDARTVMPKLIYTIPTFQNPTGVTMPLERRKALVELAREREILIVEDDPYCDLWFDELPPPALRSLDDNVAYCGTFSKTIAPSIRSGWVVAPTGFQKMLAIMKEVADINHDKVMMRTVLNAVPDFLDEHLVGSRELYRVRRDAMLAGLERHMPAGTSWSQPAGGFFVWVTLPEGLNAIELLPFAVERFGVAYLAGEWFYPGFSWPEASRTLRLSYSKHPEARIEEGMRRLGAAISAALETR
ncbi:MAG: PLP-dependent aminotransferase family protein [Thermomicrobiales bacterium]|nr:PLP-dependent aminotransferase family protein [Thermomicrobiales bacterium]